MLEAISDWAGATPLSAWVRSAQAIWVTLETLHFIGLSVLLGALLVIDLRLAGLFKRIPLGVTHKLLPFVFFGFGLNLITGILFYFGDPGRYTINIGFQIKMILVALAGLNAILYYVKIDPELHKWDQHGDTPAIAKAIGSGSLILWFGVLICGRLIPYVGTG